ncbi:MAG: response regulator [Candidatus Izemoplasmatales bacterium]
MKIKDIGVKMQLTLVFIIVIFLVLVLGAVSITETVRLNNELKTLYEHPLTVKHAYFEIKSAALESSIDIRNLAEGLEDDKEVLTISYINIDYSVIDTYIQVLYDDYLGPVEDVDNLQYAYVAWKSYRDYTIQLILADDFAAARERLYADEVTETNRVALFDAIKVIEDYSTEKADLLYANAQRLNNELILFLSILILFIVSIKIWINSILVKQITIPLTEIKNKAQLALNGDFSMSTYESKNEFGELSDAFNQMISSIENSILKQKQVNKFNEDMVKEQLPEKIYQQILLSIMDFSNSHVGILYVKENNSKLLRAKSSMGIEKFNSLTISTDIIEKEYGIAMYYKKPYILKDIPSDTALLISTTFQNFNPKEILSIPVYSASQLIALITLGNYHPFKEDVQEYLESISDSIRATIESAMAVERANLYLLELEDQNQELESQQMEISSMNQELEQQNTLLEVQKKQLADANLHKTNFLSTMSHELRTPLNSVIALSGVLKRQLEGKISEEDHQYIEVIERNGKNLLLLINDILDISRVESGRVEVLVSEFNPCDAFNDLVSNLSQLAKQKNLEVKTICTNHKIMVESDRDKMSHIMQNLISNAIKFTEKGKITIELRDEKDHIEIIVSDTGIGISEDQIPFIFDEFRQADATTSRKYGGTGLGLAIAKKYALLLEGNISVQSILGKGTTFTLTIPKKMKGKNYKDANVYPTHFDYHDRLNHPRVHESKSVLVVDDNKETLHQIKELLESEQYMTQTAVSYEDVIAYLDKETPDLILLDLIIPQISGFEILKKLREREETLNTPILIMTAKEISGKELKELKKYGVERFIQKGELTSNSFLDTIYTILFDIAKEARPIIKPVNQPVVLIVEDNPDNMLTTKALLKGQYKIVEATNGLEGVEQAKKYLPDLILMDIALPVMDGIQAFKKIHELPQLSSTPVIALTASAMLQDRRTILAHGFTAFISKPLNEKEFLSTIEEVLYGS